MTWILIAGVWVNTQYITVMYPRDSGCEVYVSQAARSRNSGVDSLSSDKSCGQLIEEIKNAITQ